VAGGYWIGRTPLNLHVRPVRAALSQLVRYTLSQLEEFMAVHRNRSITLQIREDEVVEQARKILLGNPAYKNTKEQDKGCFVTNVKPSWWLLGTAMTVRITGGEDSTTIVQVSTKSQPFIMGDVFDYYNRYIQEFLSALQQTVKT
jgi:hypothetical protein